MGERDGLRGSCLIARRLVREIDHAALRAGRAHVSHVKNKNANETPPHLRKLPCQPGRENAKWPSLLGKTDKKNRRCVTGVLARHLLYCIA